MMAKAASRSMATLYPIQILELFVSAGHDFKKRFGMERLNHETTRVGEVECVAGMGIANDRYFGYKEDFKGQISFIAMEAIEALAKDLCIENVDTILFRRNVVTRGIDLGDFIGKRFRIGGVVFFGAEECRPCFWMDGAVAPGACSAMEGRGGLRCRILESGALRVGAAELELIG